MTARRAVRVLVLAALAAGSLGLGQAQAQRFERRAPRAEGFSGLPGGASGRFSERGRGGMTYTVPQGFGGTITATTPNEYGNLGGPTTGGGNGGGR